jgi:HD-like signal output (HDOD) protein
MSNQTASNGDLKRILVNAQLPALPQSAIRLLELSQDPANGPIEFAVPIEADPGLTGQVLKFVNSSYFGFSREISSIKLAITLVGIRTIKNFALWSAVFSLMPNPKCGPFVLKSLWQDSLRRALFARAFGKLLGIKEPEEQFAAALLQDMAVPLLAKENTKSYVELLEARNNGHVRLSHLEQEAFGWTHSEAAGLMARQWNLPEAFADMIEGHHNIDTIAANSKANPGKTAVALSALLPTVADSEWCECSLFEKYFDKTAPSGGPTIVELLAQIDELFVSFAPVLKVSTPSKSLVESYHEVTAAAAG